MKIPQKTENCVILAANTEGGAATLTFVAGTGTGLAWGDMAPIILDPAGAESPDPLVAAGEAATNLFHGGETNDKMDVFLIEDSSIEAARVLSDDAIGRLGDVLYDEFEGMALAETGKEIITLLNGAASPIMLLMRRGRADVVSVRLPHDDESNEGIVFRAGEWHIYPVRLTLEDSVEVPDTLFDAAVRPFMRNGTRVKEPTQAGCDSAWNLVDAWFWDKVSTGMSDPLIGECRLELEAEALKHPVKFAVGDEDSMAELVRWALELDSQTIEERHQPFSSRPMHARHVRVSTAFEDHPAKFTGQYVSRATSIILQEICAWSWPRGSTVRGFATNRLSSAVHGPALRDVSHNTRDSSGHEILTAADGIAAFLRMRGFEAAEIHRLVEGRAPQR